MTPMVDHAMLRETAKNPRAISQTLQSSVSLLDIKCHDNANGKRLNKYGLFHVWLVSQEETAQVCKEFEF